MKQSMYTRLAALLIGMQLFLGGCAKVKERGDMTLDELKTKTTALLKKQDYSERFIMVPYDSLLKGISCVTHKQIKGCRVCISCNKLKNNVLFFASKY